MALWIFMTSSSLVAVFEISECSTWMEEYKTTENKGQESFKVEYYFLSKDLKTYLLYSLRQATKRMHLKLQLKDHISKIPCSLDHTCHYFYSEMIVIYKNECFQRYISFLKKSFSSTFQISIGDSWFLLK